MRERGKWWEREGFPITRAQKKDGEQRFQWRAPGGSGGLHVNGILAYSYILIGIV